jgi:hypothetical protein
MSNHCKTFKYKTNKFDTEIEFLYKTKLLETNIYKTYNKYKKQLINSIYIMNTIN